MADYDVKTQWAVGEQREFWRVVDGKIDTIGFECVGYMPGRQPVWFTRVYQWTTGKPFWGDLYIAFNLGYNDPGNTYFETYGRAESWLRGQAELQLVGASHKKQLIERYLVDVKLEIERGIAVNPDTVK